MDNTDTEYYEPARKYIDVEYTRKDEAKKHGAKWDPVEKKWYVHPKNYNEFTRKFAYKSLKDKEIERLEWRINYFETYTDNVDMVKKLKDKLDKLTE